MSGIEVLRPGDIGFGPIHGGAGLLVNAGQLLLGEGFRVGDLDIRHVFVVSETGNSFSSEKDFPRAVEAMPGGARQVRILDRWTNEYAYARLSEDYPGQAADAAAIARAMIGTPYSFASYAALALWRLEALFMRKSVGSTTWRGDDKPGMGSKLEAWINRREKLIPWTDSTMSMRVLENYVRQGGVDGAVKLPCEAICSVLADQAWSLTGKKIMEGVAHQCVTPGALAGRLLTMPGTQWFWPGRGAA